MYQDRDTDKRFDRKYNSRIFGW